MNELLGGSVSATPDRAKQVAAFKSNQANKRKMAVYRGYLAESARLNATYGGIKVSQGKAEKI
jgi:hypothetical protein